MKYNANIEQYTNFFDRPFSTNFIEKYPVFFPNVSFETAIAIQLQRPQCTSVHLANQITRQNPSLSNLPSIVVFEKESCFIQEKSEDEIDKEDKDKKPPLNIEFKKYMELKDTSSVIHPDAFYDKEDNEKPIINITRLVEYAKSNALTALAEGLISVKQYDDITKKSTVNTIKMVKSIKEYKRQLEPEMLEAMIREDGLTIIEKAKMGIEIMSKKQYQARRKAELEDFKERHLKKFKDKIKLATTKQVTFTEKEKKLLDKIGFYGIEDLISLEKLGPEGKVIQETITLRGMQEKQNLEDWIKLRTEELTEFFGRHLHKFQYKLNLLDRVAQLPLTNNEKKLIASIGFSSLEEVKQLQILGPKRFAQKEASILRRIHQKKYTKEQRRSLVIMNTAAYITGKLLGFNMSPIPMRQAWESLRISNKKYEGQACLYDLNLLETIRKIDTIVKDAVTFVLNKYQKKQIRKVKECQI